MSNAPLVKIEAATAAEICGRFPLTREARALVQDGMGPLPFIDALMADKQYIAGIDFLAHALPPREGVWWGCLCLPTCLRKRHELRRIMQRREPRSSGFTAERQHASWREGARRSCGARVDCRSVGHSSVPDRSRVRSSRRADTPVPPFAAAKSIANAVKLACTKSGPLRVIETQRSFVELGLGVAAGRLSVSRKFVASWD